MKVIARITARLHTRRTRSMLPFPPIVVPIATFNLMGRGRGTPGEPAGERHRLCGGFG